MFVFSPVAIQKTERGRLGDWLQRMADAAVGAWQRLFLGATEAAQRAVDRSALRQAIDTSNPGKIVEVVTEAWYEAAHPMLVKAVPAELAPMVVEVGQASIAALPVTAELDLVFGLEDTRVSTWMARYSGERITNIDRATLDGLRQVLSAEIHPGSPALVENISDMIGLRPDQMATVLHFEQGLHEAGMKPARIHQLVEQRIEAKRMERAALIARTETLTGANAAQTLAWQVAADEGLLEGSRTRRQWLIALDACALCAAIPGLNPGGGRAPSTLRHTPRARHGAHASPQL